MSGERPGWRQRFQDRPSFDPLLAEAGPPGGRRASPRDKWSPIGVARGSNIRQRVLANVLTGANELLRKRGIPEILECTPHTLGRTYISLLLTAGCDPAYVQRQVGHTDPTLTLTIYQRLL